MIMISDTLPQGLASSSYQHPTRPIQVYSTAKSNFGGGFGMKAISTAMIYGPIFWISTSAPHEKGKITPLNKHKTHVYGNHSIVQQLVLGVFSLPISMLALTADVLSSLYFYLSDTSLLTIRISWKTHELHSGRDCLCSMRITSLIS